MTQENQCSSTISSYSSTDEVITVSSNPRHTTFDECISILEENQHPFAFEELIGTACRRNEYANVYVGPKHKLQDNKKLRPIADMLLNHSSIKCVKQKPLVLQWYKNDAKNKMETGSGNKLNDFYDQYDPGMYLIKLSPLIRVKKTIQK